MEDDTRAQFQELNKSFMRGCIQNLGSVGRDCCLAPLTKNYLIGCLQILQDGAPGPHLAELGQSLRSLGDRFVVLSAQLEKKASVPELPAPPPQPIAANSIIPPGINFNFGREPNKGFTKPEGQKQGMFGLPTPPQPVTTNSNTFQFGNIAGNVQRESNHTSSEPSSAPAEAEGDDEEAQEREALAHEFVPIAENDSLYSIRCKIFHRVDDAYMVRGVGQLYVQKTENGSYRMLIRADNSLGNILLNMNITPDLPMILNLEKKQVSTIDPHKPCPITILVKTPDLAQTLFDEIVKCQKAAV